MSRYPIQISFYGDTDEEGAIGYDRPLRTFFLQGFINEDEDDRRPEIWLGGVLEEFPTLDSLLGEAKRREYRIQKIEKGVIVSMMLEAGQVPEPNLDPKSIEPGSLDIWASLRRMVSVLVWPIPIPVI